eukprot:TRINITY_DN11920_c1_g1_i1.p1 TRINITY_DN11920_c1_g1~~TRINITY_DN11920_c1_g1_i1.p1  ORF type:complete len:207 (-),score=31.11 TRINITY_DN11920_c1_g1_i1:266-886(-)
MTGYGLNFKDGFDLKVVLKPDRLFATLDEAFPNGPGPHTSTRILSALAKQSALDACFDALVWHQLHSYELNYYHYNTVIHACGKTCMWTKALHLLGVMADDKVESDVSTFNSAIVVCREAGLWEKALQILEAVTHCGSEPNEITCTVVISACEQERRRRPEPDEEDGRPTLFFSSTWAKEIGRLPGSSGEANHSHCRVVHGNCRRS